MMELGGDAEGFGFGSFYWSARFWVKDFDGLEGPSERNRR